jgi:hypothetical protein
MTDSPEVAVARIEAARARARFFDSLRAFEEPLLELKRQLTPSHIVGDAWDAAKSKGADIAEDAVDAVRSRPVAATGAIAALALFLAREPLMDLAGNLIGSMTGKPKTPKIPKTRKPRAKPTEKSNAPAG